MKALFLLYVLADSRKTNCPAAPTYPGYLRSTCGQADPLSHFFSSSSLFQFFSTASVFKAGCFNNECPEVSVSLFLFLSLWIQVNNHLGDEFLGVTLFVSLVSARKGYCADLSHVFRCIRAFGSVWSENLLEIKFSRFLGLDSLRGPFISSCFHFQL